MSSSDSSSGLPSSLPSSKSSKSDSSSKSKKKKRSKHSSRSSSTAPSSTESPPPSSTSPSSTHNAACPPASSSSPTSRVESSSFKIASALPSGHHTTNDLDDGPASSVASPSMPHALLGGGAESPSPLSSTPLNSATPPSTSSSTSQVAKTPCRFFNMGQCNKGDTCPFLHKKAAHFSYKFCKFFSNGYCRHGDACPFNHERDSTSSSAITGSSATHNNGAGSFPLERGLATSSSFSTNGTFDDIPEYSGPSSINSTPVNMTPLDMLRQMDQHSGRGHHYYGGTSRPGSFNEGGLMHDSIPNSFDDDHHPLNLGLGGHSAGHNSGMPLSGSSDSNFALHQFIHHQHHHPHLPSSASSSPRGGAVLSRRSSSEFISVGSVGGSSLGSTGPLANSSGPNAHIIGTTYMTLPPPPGSATSPPPGEMPSNKPAPFRRQSSAQFGYISSGSTAASHISAPHAGGSTNSMNFRHPMASTSAPSSGRPAPLHRSSSTEQAIYPSSSLESNPYAYMEDLTSPVSRHYYRVPPLPSIAHMDSSASSSDTYSSPNTMDEYGSNTGNLTPSSTSSSFDSRTARRSRTFSGASAATATLLGMSAEFGDNFSELGTSDEDVVDFWEFHPVNGHNDSSGGSGNAPGDVVVLKRTESPTEDSAVPMASVHRRVIEGLLEDEDDDEVPRPTLSFSQSSSASTTREISPRYGMSSTPSSNSISTANSNPQHMGLGTPSHIAPTAMRRASLINSNHSIGPSNAPRVSKPAGGPPIPLLSRTRKGSFSKSHEDLLHNRDSGNRMAGSNSSLLTSKNNLSSSSATLGSPVSSTFGTYAVAGNASTAASTAPILTTPHPTHHLSYASAGAGAHVSYGSSALEYDSVHALQNHGGGFGMNGGNSYTISPAKRPTPIPPKLGSFKSVSSVRLVIPSPAGTGSSAAQNSIANSGGSPGGGRLTPKISKIGKSQSETSTQLSSAISSWRERRREGHSGGQLQPPVSSSYVIAPSNTASNTSSSNNIGSATATMAGGDGASSTASAAGVHHGGGGGSYSISPNGSGTSNSRETRTAVHTSLSLASLQDSSSSIYYANNSSQPTSPASTKTASTATSMAAHETLHYQSSSASAVSSTRSQSQGASNAPTSLSGAATSAAGGSNGGSSGGGRGAASSNHSSSRLPASTSSSGSNAHPPYRKQHLCMFHVEGFCRYGDLCKFVHGLPCKMCGKPCIFPDAYPPIHNEKHYRACRLRRDIEESRKLRCAVCGIAVVDNELKFGILPDCNDVLCVPCLKDHRTSTSRADCPVCKTVSHFLIPSHSFPQTPEKKIELTNAFKLKLKQLACKYFDYGKGSCRYGEACHYHHLTYMLSPRLDEREENNSGVYPPTAASPSPSTGPLDSSSVADFQALNNDRSATSSPTVSTANSVVQDARASGPGKEDAPPSLATNTLITTVAPAEVKRGRHESRHGNHKKRSGRESKEDSMIAPSAAVSEQ